MAKAQAVATEILCHSSEPDGAKLTVKLAKVDVVGELVSGFVDFVKSLHGERQAEALRGPQSLSLENIALSSACGGCVMQFPATTKVPHRREPLGSDIPNHAGTKFVDGRRNWWSDPLPMLH
jgi:hypothetical protein